MELQGGTVLKGVWIMSSKGLISRSEQKEQRRRLAVAQVHQGVSPKVVAQVLGQLEMRLVERESVLTRR